MTEDEFWRKLEWRICLELSETNDKIFRWIWCDGIRGNLVRPPSGQPYLAGSIWIGSDGQTEMQFTMQLPREISIDGPTPWSALLPAENLTGWLFVDLQKKIVAIDLNRAETFNS
ncbi:MAG: hypothetical protein ABL893_19105 [Hyphomicrobium sp.]|nr:hypothetical protein [Hyphomicrobium sp.]